jgi:type IV pilus assembly protein PilO
MIKFSFPIDKIEFWPQWFKRTCLCVVFAVVLLIGYALCLKTTLLALYKAHTTQTTLKKQVAQSYSDLKNINLYQAQIEQLTNLLNTPFPRLLNQNEESLLTDAILQEANHSGMVVTTFNPGASLKKEFYSENEILLNLSGNYYNFSLFCNALISLKPIVLINSFHIMLDPSIKGVQTDPKLAITLSLRLYSLNSTKDSHDQK